MNTGDADFGWSGFLVRAVLGGVVGLLIGLGSDVFLFSTESAVVNVVIVATSVVACALAAGLYGDRFWASLKEWI